MSSVFLVNNNNLNKNLIKDVSNQDSEVNINNVTDKSENTKDVSYKVSIDLDQKRDISQNYDAYSVPNQISSRNLKSDVNTIETEKKSLKNEKNFFLQDSGSVK